MFKSKNLIESLILSLEVGDILHTITMHYCRLPTALSTWWSNSPDSIRS